MSDLRQALAGKFVDEDVEFLGEIFELIRVLVYGTKRSNVAFELHAAHPFSFGTHFALFSRLI